MKVRHSSKTRGRWRGYALAAGVCGLVTATCAAFLLPPLGAPPTVASTRGAATIGGVIADTAQMSANEKLFFPVMEQLLAEGANPEFVKRIVNHADATLYEKLTKITVPIKPVVKSTPSKTPPKAYQYAYNAIALKKSTEFLMEHDSLLRAVERRYNVPKEALASIMWVETRFGDFLGSYHVPSVYLSFALVTQPEYLQKNKDRLKTGFTGTDEEWVAIETKLEEKSQRKASWAMKELLALQKMYVTNPPSVLDLRGSWAGAFGLSQFLPSSYLKLAVDGNNDGVVNLFDVADAAHSVGNYLSAAGWSKAKKAQHRAVYNYNHSDAYVNAVLGLTKRLATATQPATAGKPITDSSKPAE
jgi:membrane-bound lytic murein transglycosylase B